MFPLNRAAVAPTPKSQGVCSQTRTVMAAQFLWRSKLSCAAPKSKVKRHISGRFCAIIGQYEHQYLPGCMKTGLANIL